MNRLDLSIIIPTYNVEKYIKKCIESVLQQNLDNYEIIIINDGSTDKTNEILEKYKNIKSIKIINQKNKGLSGARNTGLKNCIGKYVLFLDSDDFVEKNSIKKILNEIQHNDLEILAFNFWTYYNKERYYLEKRKLINKKNFSGEEYLKSNLLNKSYPMSWLNIYNKEFLLKNNLFFKEGILHEDIEFNIRLLLKVKKMSYLNVPIIYYRQREGSITKKKLNRRYSYIKILKTYLEEIKRIKDKELIQLLYNYMSYISKNVIIESIKGKDFKFLIKNKTLLKNILKKSNKIKYKCILLILLIIKENNR